MSEQVHNSREAKRRLLDIFRWRPWDLSEITPRANSGYIITADWRAFNIGHAVAQGIYYRLAPIYGTDEDPVNLKTEPLYVEELAEIDRLNMEAQEQP